VLSVVSWGRCIFRCKVSVTDWFMQSKNKACEHAFNLEGWALPGVMILKVAVTRLRPIRNVLPLLKAVVCRR
jgi:hypothetical protein